MAIPFLVDGQGEVVLILRIGSFLGKGALSKLEESQGSQKMDSAQTVKWPRKEPWQDFRTKFFLLVPASCPCSFVKTYPRPFQFLTVPRWHVSGDHGFVVTRTDPQPRGLAVSALGLPFGHIRLKLATTDAPVHFFLGSVTGLQLRELSSFLDFGVRWMNVFGSDRAFGSSLEWMDDAWILDKFFSGPLRNSFQFWSVFILAKEPTNRPFHIITRHQVTTTSATNRSGFRGPSSPRVLLFLSCLTVVSFRMAIGRTRPSRDPKGANPLDKPKRRRVDRTRARERKRWKWKRKNRTNTNERARRNGSIYIVAKNP